MNFKEPLLFPIKQNNRQILNEVGGGGELN